MPDSALFKSDPRSYALELIEEGADMGVMLLACLNYMSHDDVRDMLDTNEQSPRFDDEDEDEDEDYSS